MIRAKAAKLIAVVCAIGLASMFVGTVGAFALTKAGGEAYAAYHAEIDWPGKGPAETSYCTGPYENKVGKTQWACYGDFPFNCFHWQVNVGPYGEQTYEKPGGCPAIVQAANGAEESPAP